MIYHVKARFRDETAADLLSKLADGTIASQRPDGQEIVASMERAVIGSGGIVEWTETCFCTPPLAHERQTQLDHHFEDLTTEPIGRHRTFDGQPFMEYLRMKR